jgi:hypothetical protein
MSEMKRSQEEPLLPPWVVSVAIRLGVLVAAVLLYYLFSAVFRVPAVVQIPVMAVVALGVLIYFGGRLYKPFFVDRQAKCLARSPQQRATCRHFVPGARLGGGCGRLREDGRCRYIR